MREYIRNSVQKKKEFLALLFYFTHRMFLSNFEKLWIVYSSTKNQIQCSKFISGT